MTKVLMGIIGNDAARFHLFTSSVMKLDTEGIEVDKEMLIGGDWCGARNTLVDMTLEGDYTHLWFMDDDHAFPSDLLKQLLSHDLAMVNPLCLTRVAPFPLVVYAPIEDGVAGKHLPIDLTGLPGEGLVEVSAVGCAGMLIRREVLAAVRDLKTAGGDPVPCFEYGEMSEDVLFCHKARLCGFQIYADLAARLGHITTTVVYPDIDQGNWMTRLKIGGGLDLFVSPAQDWQEEDALEAQRQETIGRLAHEVDYPSEKLYPQPVTPEPVEQTLPEPDRIEVWMDEARYWYWRVIPAVGGLIIASGSGISEDQVIADAMRSYPDLTVHLIQRDIDDSRSTRQFGPPTRLWNRGG